MKRLSLDEVKEIELDILIDFDRVCQAHHLDYFLAFGTCLGAMRHGGFIPWDDDIDVFMPRESYEKLPQALASEKSPYLLTTYRDQSSIYPFFKLTDPTTRTYEQFTGERYPTGIWMDIFPIERVDPGHPAMKWLNAKNEVVSLIRSFNIADSETASTPLIKLIKKIVCPAARLLDSYKLCATIDDNARSVTKKTKADISNPNAQSSFANMYSAHRILDGSLLFPTIRGTFESHTFNLPAQPERYLEFTYGDWEELPPESQREPHLTEAWQLDDRRVN